MNIKRKNSRKIQISAVLAVLITGCAGAYFLFSDKRDGGHIFGRNDGIGINDVHTLKKHVDFENVNPAGMVAVKKSGSSGRDDGKTFNEASVDFSDGRGVMMLKYFRFLQNKFNKSGSLAIHCADIWKYLLSVMPENEAEKLYALYRKHLECEIELAKKISEIGQPKTLDEILAGMEKIHAFRREMLGSEMADGLYGVETKTREYALRRGSVVSDQELYGQEKEALLEKLTAEMWEDSPEEVQSVQNTYNSYREGLEIYSRDMKEMPSDEERSEKIAAIRQKYFTPEVIARLEKVDSEVRSEKENKDIYRQREAEITASSSMNENEKKEAVENLQAQFFGDEAEAFRRQEAIRLAGEQMHAEYSR